MGTLVTRTDDGAELIIETVDSVGGFQQTGAKSVVSRTEDAFTVAVDTLKKVSRQFVQAVDQLGSDAPDSFELSFGIKFAADGTVWVAKVSAEAQLVAKVSWRRRT